MIQGIFFDKNTILDSNGTEISWLELTPPVQNSDDYYHDFIQKNLLSQAGAFVVEFPFNKANFALQFATHLRFSNFTQAIYLISNLNFDDFREQNPNSLLTNKLVEYINLQDQEDNLIDIQNEKMDSNALKKAIDNQTLIIAKPDKTPNHTIANEWGAFKLASAVKTLFELAENSNVKEKMKKLYFKYLCLKYNIKIPAVNETPETIDCKGKRILLIDDQADRGWEDIFKIVFQNGNFNSVPIFFLSDNKQKDENKIFEEAEKMIENGEWDVILLDLRLKSTDRVDIASFNDISKFSGYRLLEKIKTKNKGTQVIVFTASNKAWNMKALIEAGADGYYIKESPDFQYEENYAQENFEAFKKDVEKAIEKAGFLKWFWAYTEELKNFAKEEYKDISDLVGDLTLSLDYAFDTIANFHSQNPESQKFLNYTFAFYCSLMESVLDSLVITHTSSFNVEISDYKLVKTQSFAEKDVIKYDGSKYETELSYIEKTEKPAYFKKTTAQEISKKKFNEYTSFKDLSPLCKFASVVLLRHSGFSEAVVLEYEYLKIKRNTMLHNNKLKTIDVKDCQDIFRMLYAVLKGEKLP